MKRVILPILFILLAALVSSAAAQSDKYQDAAPQPLASAPDLKANYEGYLGKRIDDVIANW
ncbi:MAG: hypothetical protein ACI4QC_02400, partial [Thermoguttaceae bacterium]